MEKTNECPKCGFSLSEDVITKQSNPTAPLWKRKGYCSLACYNDREEARQIRKKGPTLKPKKYKTNPKRRSRKSKPSPILEVLYGMLLDGLGFSGTVLIISGAYGFLTASDGGSIGSSFKWAGIAFIVGCVYGLRRIFY